MKSMLRGRHFHLAPVVFVILTMIVAACGGDRDSGQTRDAVKNARAPMPDDLRAAYIASVQRDAPEAYHAHENDGFVYFTNSRQTFGGAVDQKGLSLRSEQQNWHFSLRTVGVGCVGTITPLPDGAPTTEKNRVELGREGLTEWYLNGPLGVEQGFVLHEAPACTGPKRIEMALQSDLTAKFEDPDGDGRGNAVRFVDVHGQDKLAYTDLVVADATGKTIPAWLSVSGNEMAIVVDDTGAVYPLAIDPLVWGQQAKLLASDAAAADVFGVAISVVGDTALIGAPLADVGTSRDQGEAYVFVRNGTQWTEQAKLIASDGGSYDRFGVSVSLSGDTALVGASEDNDNQGPSIGWAYVFVRNGSTWTEQAKLVSDSMWGDYFGRSVSLSGDTALVGAPGDTGGVVYVFARNGTTWSKQAMLKGSAAIGYFGDAVALVGDTALIGSLYSDIGVNKDQGAAYVFVRNGLSWTEEAMLVSSDGSVGDVFGSEVSLSGDTALVGAPGANMGANSSQGAAYVFVRNGSSWTEQAKLVGSDGAAADRFGASVAMEGDTALIGSRFSDIGTFANQGAAYVFVRNGSSWTEQTKLVANDGWPNNQFGVCVSLSGDTAFVGARQVGLGGNSGNLTPGAAYVFVFRQATGDACVAATDCTSGFCVDGVCCDSECGNGDPNDCQACAIATGATTDGECALVAMGTECRASTHACDIAENCTGTSEKCPADMNASDGTVCPDGTCVSGECMADGAGGAGGMSGSSSSGTGGSIDPGNNGGCACQTHSNSAPLAPSIALLGLVVLMRRRREHIEEARP